MVILKKIALPVIHLYFKASKKVRIEPKSDGMKYHLLNYDSGTSGRCQWAFCKKMVCGQITLRNSLNILCHLHISLVKALRSPAVGKLVSLWHFPSSLTAESFYWGSQYATESSLGIDRIRWNPEVCWGPKKLVAKHVEFVFPTFRHLPFHIFSEFHPDLKSGKEFSFSAWTFRCY